MITDITQKSRAITGVMMNYFHICQTELWYFSHDVEMEHSSDLVALGKLTHEEYYTRDSSKDEFLLEGIRLDRVTPDGYVHEVKKSDRAEEAHLWQLKYYLWKLKQHDFGTLHGVLEFPKQRKRIEVDLTEDDEKQLSEKLVDIKKIISMPLPPNARKIPFCRQCSYRELCWC